MLGLIRTISSNLAAFPRIAIDPTGHRQAAVAIVLAPRWGRLSFLLTRRALTLRRFWRLTIGVGGSTALGLAFDPLMSERPGLA